MKYIVAESIRAITFLLLFSGGAIYQLNRPDSTIFGYLIVFLSSLLHWGLSVLYAKLLYGRFPNE